MLRTRLAESALAATICCLIGPVSGAQPDARIAKGRTQEVDSISVSLSDYEFGGAEGAPLGKYVLHAKYLVDDRSAADEGITPLAFDRPILLIDVVEDH